MESGFGTEMQVHDANDPNPDDPTKRFTEYYLVNNLVRQRIEFEVVDFEKVVEGGSA